MEVRRGIPQDDNVQGGITPETMTMTPEGLIVGVRRSGQVGVFLRTWCSRRW
jgi:hypothetical protein